MTFGYRNSARHSAVFLRIASLVLLVICSMSNATASELQRGTITSQIDNLPDFFAVAIAESGKKSGLMFVYLHGAGCDFTEPFLKPDALPCSEALLSMYPDAILLSPNYGKQPSWGNDASLADLDVVIRRVVKDHGIKRIVLIGNSMGASVALLYASVAAPDLRKVITGVVAAQPASDLSELYNTTQQAALPPTMSAALGATPQEQPALYARKSVTNSLSSISKQCRLAIITAEKDTVVPFALQRRVIERLKTSGLEFKIFPLNGAHGCQNSADIIDAVDFVNAGKIENTAKLSQ